MKLSCRTVDRLGGTVFAYIEAVEGGGYDAGRELAPCRAAGVDVEAVGERLRLRVLGGGGPTLRLDLALAPLASMVDAREALDLARALARALGLRLYAPRFPRRGTVMVDLVSGEVLVGVINYTLAVRAPGALVQAEPTMTGPQAALVYSRGLGRGFTVVMKMEERVLVEARSAAGLEEAARVVNTIALLGSAL